MTQITIDVQPETAQHIHAMLDAHPGLTFRNWPAGCLTRMWRTAWRSNA